MDKGFPNHTGRVLSMTSIIIAVHNSLEYTKQCIQSVRDHSRDYELIVIDNASGDETADWLTDQDDVTVLRNDANVGFPISVNQGAARAAGDHLCLLNNDCIVTPGWLDRLLACMGKHRVDIVGPVTNICWGRQQIHTGDYDPLTDLPLVSQGVHYKFRGQFEYANFIIGFCMLMTREVFKASGPFDERYGIGNYEEIDFCISARTLGYRLGFTKDVFIHHYGQVTMKELGIDQQRLSTENLGKLLDKWQLHRGAIGS
ncbi:glycosyltransferase family 2 protein [Thermodesulfobacteriota bacterium]